MEENVGKFIGLDGRTAVITNSYFNIDNPQPGELTVNNTVDLETPLPASEQGVYTCRIPLESGEQRDINIGLYPIGFNSTFHQTKIDGYYSCGSVLSGSITIIFLSLLFSF